MGRREALAKIDKRSIRRSHIDISYPNIKGLRDQEIQIKINLHIREKVCEMLQIHYFQEDTIEKIAGMYRVYLNKRSVLSMIIEYYSFVKGRDNSYVTLSSINAGLKDGKIYSLTDLFKENTDYICRINNIIKNEVLNKGIALLNDFRTINDHQDFYISDEHIVIYIQSDSFEKEVNNIFQFTIPYIALIDIIDERGPIARIL